jgi:hypothetical protein
MNDQTLLELVRRADPLAAAVGEPPSGLLERVLASPRGERPGRLRSLPARLALVGAVFGVSAVIVGLSIAGTGWLTGEPAPPEVVTNFQAYTPQLGFHPDPGSAVLVAEDGPVKLYATTDREGTYCLDLVAPWKPATTRDGGTCVPKPIASQAFVAGMLGGGPDSQQGMTMVVAGRIADSQARSVQFTGPDGQTVARPVGSSGFFVTTLATPAPCAGGDWSSTFTALDSDGNVVAHTSSIPLIVTKHSTSKERGPILSCVFAFFRG